MTDKKYNTDELNELIEEFGHDSVNEVDRMIEDIHKDILSAVEEV